MNIYSSTHSFNTLSTYDSGADLLKELRVIKNEEFGFFVAFNVEKRAYVSLGRHYDLPWWGLWDRYRFETLVINSENHTAAKIESYLCSYIEDDDKSLYADVINSEKALYYEKGAVPIYISGSIAEGFVAATLSLRFNLYKSSAYDAEELIESRDFNINIMDFSLEEEDRVFFLDLWQHPCSWARTYGLEYFSDRHFELIEKYIRELSKLGQCVIDLIVSDFPWAGQACFMIENNPSRLYEYNMVRISKRNGEFIYDFSIVDRYIELCLKYNICKEINLFGICGNWHGFDFKSPMTDYEDPIRLSFYDEDRACYDYIRNKAELGRYLKALFAHLDSKGYMPITKIIGDEPSDYKKFTGFHEFLSSCYEKELKFKYALHSATFLNDYKGSLESFSLNSAYIGYYVKNGRLEGILKENSKEMTWYPCCFPKKLNTFVSSPLIESRYLGLYTYLWKFKGMLRWAYGLYTEKPLNNISYKPKKWQAGDMFFVYPGKDMEIMHSVREKNMLFAIQDFNIFKKLEKQGVDVENYLREKMEIKLLAGVGDKELSLKIDEYKDYEYYKGIRDELIRSFYEK